MQDMVIKNGRVVTPEGVVRGGLAVKDGKITHVGDDAALPPASDVVDAGGHYIMPGLIDPHVHIGRALEEDFTSQFRTESASAAIGGVTTMMGFVRYGEVLQKRLPVYLKGKETGRRNSYIDFKFHAYLFTDEQMDEIPQLLEAGITSTKLFLNNSAASAAERGYRAIDFGFVYKVLEMMAGYGPPALVQAHCEQRDIIDLLSRRLESQGRTDFPAYAEARPAICETMHAFCLGLIALETKCPVYIVHVSSGETVEAIKYLRQLGARIYAETCPHYLTLTADTPQGVLARMEPPLRRREDVEDLWQAVADGTIDTIGSDHVPLPRRQKEADGLWRGLPGVGGIGAILPLLLTEGVHKGRLDMEQLARLTSENAARIFGIHPCKGVLRPGADADVIIVDADRAWTLSAANLRSCSDYSIYEGWPVRGRAAKTFVRGRLVAADGQIVAAEPGGDYVMPCSAGDK